MAKPSQRSSSDTFLSNMNWWCLQARMRVLLTFHWKTFEVFLNTDDKKIKSFNTTLNILKDNFCTQSLLSSY